MKYLLIFSLILTAHFTFAQTTGKIFFEEKVDHHRYLTPDREEVKHMISQFSASKWEFIFNGDESIYQAVKEKEITGTTASQPYMRYNRENRIIYKHLTDDKVTDSRDFMQKQFLIKGFTIADAYVI